ncbi:MAG TPA: MFS transporter [Caldilineaceae bacterium]|nr:MFS transporter [Caldilineaceae bacterium]
MIEALRDIGAGEMFVLPYGWRTLYLVGWVALFFCGWLFRTLPETERFQQQQASHAARPRQAISAPLQRLLRAYPARLLTIALVIILVNLGGDAALFYDSSYLQQAHGWQPWQVSLLNLGAGYMALVGSAAGGRLSDRLGRKRTTSIFLTALPLFIIGYYNVGGWLLPLLWAVLLFTSIGAGVALGALSSELFPTSFRSTASGAMSVVATLFGALCLVLHGWLFQRTGSAWQAVSILALLLFFAPLLITRLPETSGRSLEEIAPER